MSAGSTKRGSTNNNKTGFPQPQSLKRRRSAPFQEQFVAKMSRRDRQPTSKIESLISAIESIDVDTVEKLLKSDFEHDYGNTSHSVLHIAVEQIFSETMFDCFKFKSRSEAIQRIVEVLLESGRFNVNALTVSSETPLLVAVADSDDSVFSSDAHGDLINAVIELLLKNNANINAKNKDGQTSLMEASRFGYSQTVELLLNWRDELGAGADLNAKDIYGETALIKAAKWAQVDVVELLLQHGCCDEFHDHRGFYALHAVIYGDVTSSEYTSSDFFAVTGVLASEKTQVNRNAAQISVGQAVHIDRTEDDSIQKIVRLLVTRGRADINSLDLRGNTVLDLALKSKRRISRETIEKLREYGATSSALLKKHPEYPKTPLEYTDKLGKTPLHRLSAVISLLTFGEKVALFNHRLNISPHKEAFEEMTVAKDHRGRTVLHHAVMSTGIINDVAVGRSISSDDIILLINVLKLKRTINKRDNYGRTPLHYCIGEHIYKSLVEQGANEHIPDIDGKTPRDLKELRNEEHKRYHVFEKLEGRLIKNEIIDAWMIWNDSEYAYRDEFSNKICDKVQHIMNKLSDEISKRDPRFECRPVLIGSSEEGTKTGLPDEFDFNFILTKLSEVCEVVPSPEAPSGFVHLKKRSSNDGYRPENQDFKSQDDFDKFFNSGGFLLTSELACRFRILYLQVLSESEFWEHEDFFERDQYNEVGRINDKQKILFQSRRYSDDFMASRHPCSTIQLKLNRPVEGRYMFTLISVDIVPCIKLNSWWPEEYSGVNGDITFEGCHLVFDQPQRNYPWVPFSDPFARISFAPAESRIIKECPAVARAAYMVGKQLLHDEPKLTYVLKTCLLYCVEALVDRTRNSLLYEEINPQELRFFVEKLILCFHEFYVQDFLPCYMMPSFHLPIEGYLKSRHDKGLTKYLSFEYPWFAHKFSRRVRSTDSPAVFYPPTPEPLNEKFNREELLRKLSMNRSLTEQQLVLCKK